MRDRAVRDLEVIKRMEKVREDVLVRRITNHRVLAARHNLSVSTISKYIKRIKTEASEQFHKRGWDITSMSWLSLNDVIQKCQAGFERSKKEKVKIRTEYQREKCKYCKGNGIVKEDDFEEECDNCEGNGFVTVEIVTEERTGQAGDPRFLNLIKDCVKEQCKLAGIYPKNGEGININMIAPSVDLSKISDDDVLDALSKIQSKVLPNSSNDDEDILDVDFDKEN